MPDPKWTYDRRQRVHWSPDRMYSIQQEGDTQWSVWKARTEGKLMGAEVIDAFHRTLREAKEWLKDYLAKETGCAGPSP